MSEHTRFIHDHSMTTEEVLALPLTEETMIELRRRWWLAEARELAEMFDLDASSPFLEMWAQYMCRSNRERMEAA